MLGANVTIDDRFGRQDGLEIASSSSRAEFDSNSGSADNDSLNDIGEATISSSICSCCSSSYSAGASSAGSSSKLSQPDSHQIPDSVGIKRYGISELQMLVAQLGQPTYRADQLIEWLYGRGVIDYQMMSNLPGTLRESLLLEQPIAPPQIVERQQSTDGSRKYLLQLADGANIEVVGIPDKQRLTVCFSTQVGCGMGCSFCATGQIGLIRQLAPGEMVDQLLVVAKDFDRRVTNAVAMGEGEPFANYQATIEAMRLINHPLALNIGARHITVSTSGIIQGIMNLATEPEQFRLAVSLHSARQRTRDILMPGLSGQKVSALHQTLIAYGQASGRRISLEYSLIDGINDTELEIEALISFAEDLNCHINLIPLNPVGAVDAEVFKPTPTLAARAVRQQLLAAGIETSLRRSRGADIAGACGQLAGM